MYYFKYKTKIGDIYISANDDYILGIKYNMEDNYKPLETKLIKKAASQINEYLSGNRKTFNLPVLISGTKFEQDVYNSLLKIGYGETISYKGLGELIKKDKAARAIGGACNKNPYAIVVPCHRVISSNNDLTGYAGGLNIKIDLLTLEGVQIKNGKAIIWMINIT